MCTDLYQHGPFLNDEWMGPSSSISFGLMLGWRPAGSCADYHCMDSKDCHYAVNPPALLQAVASQHC